MIVKGQAGSASSRKQCIEGGGSQQDRAFGPVGRRYLEWVVPRTGSCTKCSIMKRDNLSQRIGPLKIPGDPH